MATFDVVRRAICFYATSGKLCEKKSALERSTHQVSRAADDVSRGSCGLSLRRQRPTHDIALRGGLSAMFKKVWYQFLAMY